jgi:hypothetical protein
MSVDEKTLRNAVIVYFCVLNAFYRTMPFLERAKITSKLWELLVSHSVFVVNFNLIIDRNETTAYRNYLQAMTAYDLLPNHGIVLMLSSNLSIRKTIHALCSQTSTKAAITTDLESML